MKKYIIFIACIALAACAKENSLDNGQYTLTVNAAKADCYTKALELSGSTLNAYWGSGDVVTVYNQTKGAPLEGTLTPQTTGSATTKLRGTLTGTIETGDVLILKFLSPSYSSQTGTLAFIAANCDYAEASVTISGKSGGNLTTSSSASFVNQQAIVKFTLSNGGSALSVNKLFVTAGGTTCEVTPSGATSELYVAVPAISSGRVTLTAQTTTLMVTSYYDYVKTGVTFAQGQYYAINASLTVVQSMDVAMSASLGRVIAADDKMYASVESATNAGTTALAVIARKAGSVYTAIAISNENGVLMRWDAAKTACESKTPCPTGATWSFPTKDDWDNILYTDARNMQYCDRLDALISKAGGATLRTTSNDVPYWTANVDGSGWKCYKSIDIDYAVFDGSKLDNAYATAYARAFLTFDGTLY